MFIPCKPHRARAQPESDLGRNRAVKTKKTTKPISMLSTISWGEDCLDRKFHNIFSSPGTNDSIVSEKNKASPFTVCENHTQKQWPFRRMLKPRQDFSHFSSLQENNTRKQETLLWKQPLSRQLQILKHSQKEMWLFRPLLLTTQSTTNRWPLYLPAEHKLSWSDDQVDTRQTRHPMFLWYILEHFSREMSFPSVGTQTQVED